MPDTALNGWGSQGYGDGDQVSLVWCRLAPNPSCLTEDELKDKRDRWRQIPCRQNKNPKCGPKDSTPLIAWIVEHS